MTAEFASPLLPDRFWNKVEVQANGCWHWTGSRNESGYGKIKDPLRRNPVRAHRWAYEVFRGPITGFLDHTCHGRDLNCKGGVSCLHRRCVNPDHLEPVTNRENLLRGRTFAARHAAKTHCLRGHEFAPDNTYVDSLGRRYCRACKRLRRGQASRPSGVPIFPLPWHQDTERTSA